MSENKTEVQGTEYKVPSNKGSTLSYPVFCHVWAKQSTSIGWHTCRFDSSLMTKDARPIKQRRRKQEVRTLYYIHESIDWSTVRQCRKNACAGAGREQTTKAVEADMRYAHGLWWNVRLTGGIVKLMTCGFSWKTMYVLRMSLSVYSGAVQQWCRWCVDPFSISITKIVVNYQLEAGRDILFSLLFFPGRIPQKKKKKGKPRKFRNMA